MNCFASAVFLSLTLLSYEAGAQSRLEGAPPETHMNLDSSSMAGDMAAMRSPVTGEPYAARKVTRSVWTLADGTKITHEANTELARDGEGRVREEIESTLASSTGGKQINQTLKSITIADPVDHSITILSDGPGKIAVRMELPRLAGLGTQAHGGMLTSMLVAPPPPPPPGSVRHVANLATSNPEVAAAMAKMRAEKDEVQTEELGQAAMDGVHVTGKRTTTTIATGKIGNDRPIVITHEEWYSPGLKIVLKSEDSDPRTGERTMVLEGLTIGDPNPALFKVPEGYKVRDMPIMMNPVAGMGKTFPQKQ